MNLAIRETPPRDLRPALGTTDLVVLRVAMRNLVGGEAADWREILADSFSAPHLYGRRGPRRPQWATSPGCSGRDRIAPD